MGYVCDVFVYFVEYYCDENCDCGDFEVYVYCLYDCEEVVEQCGGCECVWQQIDVVCFQELLVCGVVVFEWCWIGCYYFVVVEWVWCLVGVVVWLMWFECGYCVFCCLLFEFGEDC